MRNEIKKAMEVNQYSYKELANRTGYSEGVLSNFINKGNTVKFDIALDVVRLLLPEKEKEYMLEYCSESSKPDHLKHALEYSSIHLELDLLNDIVGKCLNCNNKEIKEWGNLYEIYYLWKTGDISNCEMYRMLHSQNVHSQELTLFKMFLEIYTFYTSDNYNYVEELSIVFEKEIEKIESGFMKDSFMARFYQVNSHIALYVKALPEMARSMARKGLRCNLSNSFNSFFYHVQAVSYVETSVVKMNHYASKSISLLSDIYGNTKKQEMINRFKKLNMIMSNTESMDFIPDEDDPLDLFIEGKINKDANKLIECLSRFMKSGDNLLAKLPIEQLKILGCDNSLINAIQSIK